MLGRSHRSPSRIIAIIKYTESVWPLSIRGRDKRQHGMVIRPPCLASTGALPCTISRDPLPVFFRPGTHQDVQLIRNQCYRSHTYTNVRV